MYSWGSMHSSVRGAFARYFMAGEYQPEVKDSSGPFSSFGKQVTQSGVLMHSTDSNTSRGARQRRKRGGATSPSFSIQGRWKPKKPVVDETYQPPLYSSMGEQLEGGRPSVGSAHFASGRSESYSAQHELAQAEEVRDLRPCFCLLVPLVCMLHIINSSVEIKPYALLN